ncbi:dienelactone hydrolase family protein [Halomonas sp. Bachu 37]|uniref:dienelactone hydrolase family protein n=1 Tax=Halomonas kashgarensis TaxID=3084920 RepID=UPI003216EDA1
MAARSLVVPLSLTLAALSPLAQAQDQDQDQEFSPAGKDVNYTAGDENFEGYLAQAEGDAKGTILIIHDWDGLDDYERQRADMLAEKGFDAFALDLFGQGNRPQATEDKKAATNRLYENRERMRELTLAGLEQARQQGAAEATVVMGYCFGGTAALEFARWGEAENIQGYTSFHGGLDIPEGQEYGDDTAPIFVAHGGADEMVSMEDVAQLATNLEERGITYEIGVYSGAPHAFSVFGSDAYHERADQRSWDTFMEFLGEIM